jgi:hypothetical protein
MKMLTIFGELKEIDLTSNEMIEAVSTNIFDRLKDKIIRVPFNFESAKSSYEKIVRKIPPNADKNQQFKDGVIWADCLELLKSGDVHLITSDQAFYKNREYAKGLADNLLEETKKFSNRFSISSDLNCLLEEIKTRIPLSDIEVNSIIESYIYGKILDMSQTANFDIEENRDRNLKYYITLNPSEILVKYKITYHLINLQNDVRINEKIESTGESIINIKEKNIIKLKRISDKMSWQNENGELNEENNLYISASFWEGPCKILNVVEFEIN